MHVATGGAGEMIPLKARLQEEKSTAEWAEKHWTDVESTRTSTNPKMQKKKDEYQSNTFEECALGVSLLFFVRVWSLVFFYSLFLVGGNCLSYNYMLVKES